MNLRDLIMQIERLGYNDEDAAARVCQDIVLKGILTKEKQIDIQVLDMPLLNTTSEVEGLTGVFIADIVLQILAYVAETERSFIKQRQAEGIAIAKANGVHFGNKRIEISDSYQYVFDNWANGEISAEVAVELIGVSISTFYRRCKERNIRKK